MSVQKSRRPRAESRFGQQEMLQIDAPVVAHVRLSERWRRARQSAAALYFLPLGELVAVAEGIGPPRRS